MGYDEPRSLGGREFGATLSLPIWIDYMRVALAKRPPQEFPEPDGIVRDGEDWAYEEFVGMPELKGIDLEEGIEQPPEDEAPVAAPVAAPVPAPAPAATVQPPLQTATPAGVR